MAGFAAALKLEGHRTEAGRLDAPAGRVGIAFAKQDRYDYNWRVTGARSHARHTSCTLCCAGSK